MRLGVDLLDVNVWLANGLPDHPFHPAARRYWEHEAAPRIVFCRITCLGLLRLLTTPAAMQGTPFTVPQAWAAFRSVRVLSEVGFAPEPEGTESLLETWALAGGFGWRHWTDAYLAAFARAGGYRMVSFDGDFSRFPGLSFLHLRP